MANNTNNNKKNTIPFTTNTQSNESPLVTKFSRQLSQPKYLASRFQRLVEDITTATDLELDVLETNQTTAVPRPDCKEYEDLLDIYVNDVLEGNDVQHLHPLVWDHLQSCAYCRQKQTLLTDTLEMEQAGNLVFTNLKTPSLSIPQFQSTKLPWSTQLQTQLTKTYFGITFLFNPDYLRTLLPSHQPTLIYRKDVSPEHVSHILLRDNISIGEHELEVIVTATSLLEKPDSLLIEVTMIGDTPFLQNIQVKLTLAGKTFSDFMNKQSTINLGEVSLTQLQETLESEATTFEVILENKDL